MRKILSLLFLSIIVLIAKSQNTFPSSGNVLIGTSTDAPSAILNVNSTSQGILIPKLTAAEMASISSPATGLLVYNTDAAGIYQYNGTVWVHCIGTSPTFTGLTTLTGTSLTGSDASGVLNLTQIWNTSGTPTALKVNVVNTASHASSKLLDLQDNGTSIFSVQRNGGVATAAEIKTNVLTSFYGITSGGWGGASHITGNVSGITSNRGFGPSGGSGTFSGYTFSSAINQTNGATGVTRGFYINPTLTNAADFRGLEFSNNTGWGIYGAGTANNYFAGNTGFGVVSPVAKVDISDVTLAGSGSLAGSAVNITQTWNTTGAPVGFLMNINNIASSVSAIPFDLRLGGTSRFRLDRGGNVVIGAGGFFVSNSPYTHTSGSNSLAVFNTSYAPTSGTGIFTAMNIYPTINQTGGANGITRSIYLNPTLTSAANYRSLEFTNNTGWGIYGSGTAKNYLAGTLLLGANTDAPSSILNISSTTQGVLFPRMTGTERDAIASPATGLEIYNTTTNTKDIYNGSSWLSLAASSSTTTSTLDQVTTAGNTTTNSISVGGVTSTSDALINGIKVGKGNSSIISNTAVGKSALASNTTGTNNTAVGDSALSNTTSGGTNTAIGTQALKLSTTASGNTAVGAGALTNTIASSNTAVGSSSLYNNTTGTFNVALGGVALGANTTGSNNAALGYWSLRYNTTGNENTAFGTTALRENTTGNKNVGLGRMALYLNTTGSNKIGIGYQAGYNNNGDGSVFIGYQAGYYETGTNKLYISNSNTTTPLIGGDFSTGMLGIGTAAPTATLDVVGTAKVTGFTMPTGAGAGKVLVSTDGNGSASWQESTSIGGFWTASGNNISNNNTTGFVCIGRISSALPEADNYKLYVEGAIRTRKIKVDQLTWPDYVFEKNYSLPPLTEVEKYIATHKHLKGIKSAEEIKMEGVDLGDNQAALLQKIEELTLYIIAQDKKITEQKIVAEKQQKQLGDFKTQLERLQKLFLQKK